MKLEQFLFRSTFNDYGDIWSIRKSLSSTFLNVHVVHSCQLENQQIIWEYGNCWENELGDGIYVSSMLLPCSKVVLRPSCKKFELTSTLEWNNFWSHILIKLYSCVFTVYFLDFYNAYHNKYNLFQKTYLVKKKHFLTFSACF